MSNGIDIAIPMIDPVKKNEFERFSYVPRSVPAIAPRHIPRILDFSKLTILSPIVYSKYSVSKTYLPNSDNSPARRSGNLTTRSPGGVAFQLDSSDKVGQTVC